jgi:hypothetical protein
MSIHHKKIPCAFTGKLVAAQFLFGHIPLIPGLRRFPPQQQKRQKANKRSLLFPTHFHFHQDNHTPAGFILAPIQSFFCFRGQFYLAPSSSLYAHRVFVTVKNA